MLFHKRKLKVISLSQKAFLRFPGAIFLISLLIGPGIAQKTGPPTQVIQIIGTRVSLKPPSGFRPSRQYPGYLLESLDASITVTEFPGPYAEVSSAFSNASELMKRGMSLLKRQEVTMGVRRGSLLLVTQGVSGTGYLKWIAILGDDEESVLITATFPKEHDETLSEKMRSSILTAIWDKNRKVAHTEGLNFTVIEKGELKFAKRIGNSLTFTKNGVFPSRALDDPLFVVGQTVSKIEVEDPEGFAKGRILQTHSVTDIEIEQSNKVRMDDLEGYEIIAKATDRESRKAMMIYQTMLFESQGYFILQGLVGGKERQVGLKVFKEMAISFKRKKS